MPCRSSLASISLLPRESFVRSRRPSPTSGGTAGLPGLGDGTDTIGRGAALAGAAIGSLGSGTVCLAARGFLRSGLTCLATLSQSERSSSLRARLRLGARTSRSVNVLERFIGCDENACHHAGPATRPLARCWAAAQAAALRV